MHRFKPCAAVFQLHIRRELDSPLCKRVRVRPSEGREAGEVAWDHKCDLARYLPR